jgi:hypothetical protein
LKKVETLHRKIVLPGNLSIKAAQAELCMSLCPQIGGVNSTHDDNADAIWLFD